MPKRRLMTPGPTQVPEQALLSLARQITHHRTDEFRSLVAEVLDGLKYVFQTENDVVVLASSGTGAMEAAVVNVVPRGGKALVLESGKFAERWRKIGEAFGVEVIRYEVPWGERFEAAEVARLLHLHADVVAVYATLSETSTGVGHDIEAIGRVVAPTKSLLVVDGISSVGAMECRTDTWGIDLLVVGGQKGLMSPPGLAFLAVSPAAWRQIESIDRQAFYFDLVAYRKALAAPDTPYTPAIPLIAALAESLRLFRLEGIDRIWERTRGLARATRAGLSAMGLNLTSAFPADSLTAAYVPDGTDGKRLLDRLEARFGVKLAGGQGPLKGKIFRIAHMGMIDELDILSALAALELVLVELGHPVALGCGVAAASRVLAERADVAHQQKTVCGATGAAFQENVF
ncbi:MAG: alanine--glyoxylate aminotransferase family protein [Rhodopirellula sp.]|nr:alanine--glyoxylate aminotransferase family protein [Rhodopirellula sp.]